MIRYFNLKTKTITDFIDEVITIPETDPRVAPFFDGVLNEYETLTFDDGGFPIRTQYTKEEWDTINKAKEDEYKSSNEYKINEAKAYLTSTDYKMTFDYDKDVTDVKTKRAEARALIRELEK